jgi:hypothetical protein
MRVRNHYTTDQKDGRTTETEAERASKRNLTALVTQQNTQIDKSVMSDSGITLFLPQVIFNSTFERPSNRRWINCRLHCHYAIDKIFHFNKARAKDYCVYSSVCSEMLLLLEKADKAVLT